MLNINFNDISASKGDKRPNKNLTIQNNVKILSLEESGIGIDKSKKTLNLKFEYSTNYKPDYASIKLQGRAMLLADEKEAETALKEWKEKETFNKQAAKEILNRVMNKSLLQTIVMARELDLPAPIKLPKIKDNTGDKEK